MISSHDLSIKFLSDSQVFLGGNRCLIGLWPRYGSNDPATYAGEMGIVEDEPVPPVGNHRRDISA